MRVHLKTLGCRLNEAEIETWRRDFSARGFELSDNAETSDLLVVNTCAVTAEATRKSRQLIRKAQKHNPSAKLVISGCYASLEPEAASAELGVDLIVPNPDKSRLADIAIRELQLPIMPVSAMDDPGAHLLQSGRQRAFIKVQDGCRYRCTYCIVTLARGEEHSRPAADVVDEINALHRSGIQEVVLTGVHLGGYGSDQESTLSELVAQVLSETDIPRIRLGSLEPWDLPPDFWSLFSNPRLMPHLHLPIQSGADSVLRRMARRCKTHEFQNLLEAGRAQVPNLNVTTDIIVGFPGETDDEFEQTVAFAEAMHFGHIHIFAYSPRQGTKAAGLPDPLPRETKRLRSERLHAVARKSREHLLSQVQNQVFPVLVEQQFEGSQRWRGYTPNYLKVEFDGEDNLENQVLNVEITGMDPEQQSLTGRLTG
ncbi:MAG: tRNA (N(6)-L-threonylcarbamoyladenosine(37)-C(2))-methylthiotransferase MtaB [bacterium]